MERLGSTCSYGNNDSRFKIWSYTFYHFRSYSTWKKAAISVHCMMEIHHRIFHRFFHSKNGTKSSRATAETAERQEKLQGSESFLFSLHFLAIKRGGLYVQKNEPLLSQTSDRWYRRVSRPYFPVCHATHGPTLKNMLHMNQLSITFHKNWCCQHRPCLLIYTCLVDNTQIEG